MKVGKVRDTEPTWLLSNHISQSQPIGIWGLIIFFVVGGCPVHCRMFSNTLCLYLLDASGTPLSQGSQNAYDITKCVL